MNLFKKRNIYLPLRLYNPPTTGNKENNI